MAVNQSKIRSPRQWQKWLMSGAIAGVRYKPGSKGFGTVTFSRGMRGSEIIAFYKKCGLSLPKVEDLDAFAKAAGATNVAKTPAPTGEEPWIQPFDRLPFIGRFDGQVQLSWSGNDDWNRNLGFVSVRRD